MRSRATHPPIIHPEHLAVCQRLVAIPFKRARQSAVPYLEDDEMAALLQAPDTTTAAGRRVHALMLVMYNTGARVHEVLDVRPCDLQLDRPFQVQLRGKGGKQRCCPLWKKTVPPLRVMLQDSGVAAFAEAPLFRNRQDHRFRASAWATSCGSTRAADQAVPSLARKRVSPHVLRHTAATHSLQAGVDLVVISRQLGHADLSSTTIYASLDMEAKRAAVEQDCPVHTSDPSPAA